MFKKLFILSLLAMHFSANACDVCGCSVSGLNGGFNGLQAGHLFGLSYSNARYYSEHPILFENETPLVSSEIFRSISLNSRFQLHRKFQVSISVPYHFLSRTEVNKTETTRGIGDAQLTGHYIISSKDSSPVQMRILVGAGIKAPTGNHALVSNQYHYVIPNMQPGTGSWDGILSSQAFIQRNNYGFSGSVLYRINSANRDHYRYGNQGLFQGEFTYSLSKNNWTIRPQVGVSLITSQVDYDDVSIGSTIQYSGGYFFNGSFSMLGFWKNCNLFFNVQTPLEQSFAQNTVTALNSIQFGLNYFIPKKSK